MHPAPTPLPSQFPITPATMEIVNLTRRWNHHHGKAVAHEMDEDEKCVWFLHPTKGWKRVSFKRLGIQPQPPEVRYG